MYQSDYILRMIEGLGVMLRRMLDMLRQARPEEALHIAEEAVSVVADAPLTLVDALGPDGLVQYLSAGGQLDLDRAILLARSLLARAEAYDAAERIEEADAQREKADALLHAARSVDAERVSELLTMLG